VLRDFKRDTVGALKIVWDDTLDGQYIGDGIVDLQKAYMVHCTIRHKPSLKIISSMLVTKVKKTNCNDKSYDFSTLTQNSVEYLRNDVLTMYNILVALASGMLNPTDTANILILQNITFRGKMAALIKKHHTKHCTRGYE